MNEVTENRKEIKRRLDSIRHKAAYASNPSKFKEKALLWYKENIACAKARKANYRKLNIEKERIYHRAYYKENSDKCNAYESGREASKLKAMPPWASKKYIQLWYKLSKMEESRTGKKCHVDHIVPLRSKLVCGLHCEDNMQILFASDNCKKQNIHWPEMP